MYFKNLFKLLISFEFVTILYLFSYQYKNTHPWFTYFDVTVCLNLLLIPWAFIIYFQERNRVSSFFSKEILTFLALATWFLVSTLWSLSYNYKIQKTLCFSFYTVPVFLMGYWVIAKNPERVQKLLQAFLVFSLIVLAETFHIFYFKGLGSIQDIMGTNYLITGQSLGVGSIILLTTSLYRFHNQNFKTLWLEAIFSSLLIYALMNIGGRGPVVACLLVIILLYTFLNSKPYSVKLNCAHFGLILLASLILFVSFNYCFDQQGSHFQNRMMPMLNAIKTDGSTMERLEYYQSALKAFLEHPLKGLGFGGWPLYHGLGDISYHPHNICLEVMAETGIIGLSFFLLFVSICIHGLKLGILRSDLNLRTLSLIAIFAFINACKSGDLHDNILFFFSLSLVARLKRERTLFRLSNAHRPTHTS